MRTFKVVKPILDQYISTDVEYRIEDFSNDVYYCRNQVEISCSSMSLSRFKQALRDGSIVFTD